LWVRAPSVTLPEQLPNPLQFLLSSNPYKSVIYSHDVNKQAACITLTHPASRWAEVKGYVPARGA